MDIFDRRDGDPLRSPTTGAVDLGCQLPSPALLLSTTNRFDNRCWRNLGDEDPWRARFSHCPEKVVNAAREEAEFILDNPETTSTDKVQKLAESSALCDLMDSMCAAPIDPKIAQELDGRVAVDRPLAEALAVRRNATPAGHCHEVVVSSLHHEIKSITGYPASD
ncbi:unnamed protein product, partial [Discosporangium mesarthrocarpum]